MEFGKLRELECAGILGFGFARFCAISRSSCIYSSQCYDFTIVRELE